MARSAGPLGTLEPNPVLLLHLEVGLEHVESVRESEPRLPRSSGGLPNLPTSQPAQRVSKKVTQSITVN